MIDFEKPNCEIDYTMSDATVGRNIYSILLESNKIEKERLKEERKAARKQAKRTWL